MGYNLNWNYIFLLDTELHFVLYGPCLISTIIYSFIKKMLLICNQGC